MNEHDEQAIADAAEERRLRALPARQRAQDESDLDAARAELPRALSEDSRERWRWFGRLIVWALRRL